LANLGNNPKDNLGIKKVSLSKLPMAGIIHGAHAMMYGASKYGPFNWRDNAVIASIYVDASLRHLAAWFDSKEELAEDSRVHHLGHVLANMAILLDAMETGNLIDDRPHSGKATEVLTRLNDVVRQTNDANRSPATAVYGQTGSDQPDGYWSVPEGADPVVPAPSASEDPTNPSHFPEYLNRIGRITSNWSK
jgi:hypothetical protein